MQITKYQILLKLFRQFLEFKHIRSGRMNRCFKSRLQFMFLTPRKQKHQ